MEDFNRSSYWELIFKKLDNMMSKQGDDLMEDTIKNVPPSRGKLRAAFRKLKPLLHSYFSQIIAITGVLLFTAAVKLACEKIESSAKDLLPDQTTVQLGSADPVAVDNNASTMLSQKRPIDVDSIASSRSRQSIRGDSEKVTFRVPPGQTGLFKLPDGSRVLANSMSELWYFRSKFRDNKRGIHLQGEAYFEVQPDEKKPFSVNIGTLNITVIGTSFNARNYQNEESCEVALRTGKVLVNKRTEQVQLILNPGESAVLNKISGRFSTGKHDPAVVFGWIQDWYIFQNKPLREICDELSRIYGEKIIIDSPDLAGKCFYIRFNRKKPLSTLLEYLHDNDSLNYYQNKKLEWHIH